MGSNVEDYYGEREGRANGVDSSVWIGHLVTDLLEPESVFKLHHNGINFRVHLDL